MNPSYYMVVQVMGQRLLVCRTGTIFRETPTLLNLEEAEKYLADIGSQNPRFVYKMMEVREVTE